MIKNLLKTCLSLSFLFQSPVYVLSQSVNITLTVIVLKFPQLILINLKLMGPDFIWELTIVHIGAAMV